MNATHHNLQKWLNLLLCTPAASWHNHAIQQHTSTWFDLGADMVILLRWNNKAKCNHKMIVRWRWLTNILKQRYRQGINWTTLGLFLSYNSRNQVISTSRKASQQIIHSNDSLDLPSLMLTANSNTSCWRQDRREWIPQTGKLKWRYSRSHAWPQ
jgi:hypothetical protein